MVVGRIVGRECLQMMNRVIDLALHKRPIPVLFRFCSPDDPTNHLLLEVVLDRRYPSNKRELSLYGPPLINLC